MTSSANRWNRSKATGAKPEEELFVFGYSCKIFRDDEKAIYIDQGKHLIPWMGDDSLMIDRYDVRGYLHDLSPFEAKQEYEEEVTEEEKLCDEERYLALRTNLTEEELYHEEELKRLRAAVASDGAYHEIGFSYDTLEDSNSQQEQQSVKEEEEDEPYQAPPGLNVPKGMHVPSNMKIHTIIQKTAVFISKQGGQMEIIIKMKQSDNPQFAFMHLDNPLQPYYKHLVQEIKSGRYKPLPEKKAKESEEEHHDGHYLHPSLVSGCVENVPKFTVPTINFKRTGDDSYSLLVKNLKQRIEEDAQRYSPTAEQVERKTDSPVTTTEDASASAKTNSNTLPTEVQKSPCVSTSDSDDTSSSDESDAETIIPPPPDVQPVINKMAEYVAKNGEDFETIVKSKCDKRFEFLNPGHKYYNYYIFRRSSAIEALRPSAAVSSSSPSATTLVVSQSDTVPPPPPPPPSLTVSSEIQTTCIAESKVVETSQKEVEEPEVDDEERMEEEEEEDDDDDGGGDVQACTEENQIDLNEESNSCELHSESEEEQKQEDSKVEETVAEAEPNDAEVTKPLVTPKIVKGPICFSLRTKDNEAIHLEKAKKAPLLLDDSDADEDSQSVDSKGAHSDKERKNKERIANHSSSNTLIKSSSTSETEEKPKKLSAEELELKMAEEKIKDKLMAAARERLAQHKKDKQLQLERKQKAALFLKMLQKKSDNTSVNCNSLQANEKSGKSVDQNDTPENKNGDAYSFSPAPSEITSPEKIIPISSFPPSPMSAHQDSEPSSSSSTDSVASDAEKETEKNKISEQVISSQDAVKKKKKKEKKQSISPDRKHSHKSRSKSHKHSHSKKRHRSRSRSPSRKHKRPSKPEKEKEKEKKLPAAYAFNRGSRSRSRSPRRYNSHIRSRSPLPYWNRWKQ